MALHHNLVRLGYNDFYVDEMDEDDVAEAMENATAYNKATGISGE